jgi:hypothetical protein
MLTASDMQPEGGTLVIQFGPDGKVARSNFSGKALVKLPEGIDAVRAKAYQGAAKSSEFAPPWSAESLAFLNTIGPKLNAIACGDAAKKLNAEAQQPESGGETV